MMLLIELLIYVLLLLVIAGLVAALIAHVVQRRTGASLRSLLGAVGSTPITAQAVVEGGVNAARTIPRLIIGLTVSMVGLIFLLITFKLLSLTFIWLYGSSEQSPRQTLENNSETATRSSATPGLQGDLHERFTQEPLSFGWEICQSNQFTFDRGQPEREFFLVNGVYARKVVYTVPSGGNSLLGGNGLVSNGVSFRCGLNDSTRHHVPTSSRFGREVTINLDGKASVIHVVRRMEQRSIEATDRYISFDPIVHDISDATVIRTEMVLDPRSSGEGAGAVWGIVPTGPGVQSAEVTFVFLDTVTGAYMPREAFTGAACPYVLFTEYDPFVHDFTKLNWDSATAMTSPVHTIRDIQNFVTPGHRLVISLPREFPATTKVLVNWKIK